MCEANLASLQSVKNSFANSDEREHKMGSIHATQSKKQERSPNLLVNVDLVFPRRFTSLAKTAVGFDTSIRIHDSRDSIQKQGGRPQVSRVTYAYGSTIQNTKRDVLYKLKGLYYDDQQQRVLKSGLKVAIKVPRSFSLDHKSSGQ